MASSYGVSRICATLVNRGADTVACDSYGQAPLHRAAICGSVDTVQLLLDHNVDIEARIPDFGRSAVHWAAVYGYLGVISLLIAKGAAVETRDERKWTVLHLVASHGHEEILKLLLLNECLDINAKDGYGGRALYRAAEAGHEAASRLLLLTKGAQIDIPNPR